MTIDATSVNAIIGSRIRERRKELGMRGADLARLTGLCRSFISDLENGRRGVSAENIFLISESLRVDVNYFFKPLRGSAS
jgi:hypothetical protein